MATVTCPEIRSVEQNLSPQERAEARDAYVRNFERQFADWTEIAKVCFEVERDKDYERLGYASWHQWLLATAPRSRSYIYLVTNRYKELSSDIPQEDLAKISLSAAEVLGKLPAPARRNHEIHVRARSRKVKQFRDEMDKEYPDSHIGAEVVMRLKFGLSQLEVIEDAWEAYRALEDETVSLGTFFEWVANDWLDGLAMDGITSRRMIWEKMKADANSHQERENDSPGESVQ